MTQLWDLIQNNPVGVASFVRIAVGGAGVFGFEVTAPIGLVARGGAHWNVAMEIGRTPVHPGWDWKVGVFGKFPWKGEK